MYNKTYNPDSNSSQHLNFYQSNLNIKSPLFYTVSCAGPTMH